MHADLDENESDEESVEVVPAQPEVQIVPVNADVDGRNTELLNPRVKDEPEESSDIVPPMEVEAIPVLKTLNPEESKFNMVMG